jgi:hypothetical protein
MHWKETQVFFSFACSNHNEPVQHVNHSSFKTTKTCASQQFFVHVKTILLQNSEFWKSSVIDGFNLHKKNHQTFARVVWSKTTKSKINYHGDPWVFALQTISSAEVKKMDPKGRYSHDGLWNGNTATSFTDTEYLRLTDQ